MRKVLILFFCFFFSCKPESELEFHISFEKYVEKYFNDYSDIYDQVNSWLDESKKLKRENTREVIFDPDYKVDDLLILNNQKTKLVGIVNIAYSNIKNNTHDWVFMFWGVKINNIWYFTRGGSLFVPRENYKYKINEALNHFQLSYIGRDYFLKHFLHIEGNNVSVNSDLIDKHVSIIDGYKYKENSDENWLDFFNYKNAKIVSQKEIDDINESIKNEVEDEHILPKKGTKAWKKLYGTKIPLFEREEWKTYETQLKEMKKNY